MSSNIAERATPVPIPNTAVKPFKVDGTAFARRWESRKLLGLICPAPSIDGAGFLFFGEENIFLTVYLVMLNFNKVNI